jgi:intracellular proteinase inhibitor BsuPI
MTLPAVFFRARLLLPLLVIGCGDAGDSEPVDSFAAQVEARGGVPFAQEGAVVSLDVPQSVAARTPVPITIRVKNETAAPLDLYLRGRDVTFDITVADSTGDMVWRKLEGEVTQAILQLKTLAPGEVMELSHIWDQKSQRGQLVAPGRYTVRGSVLTDGQSSLESPAAQIEIVP